jgi:hypothetical protein
VEILHNDPGLEREDWLACRAHAAGALSPQRIDRFEVA